LIVPHIKSQAAEDQEVSRRELEEEVYYIQQSFLRFVNTICQKEKQ